MTNAKSGHSNELHNAIADAAYEAGRVWGLQGNQKLPNRTVIAGVETQIVRSSCIAAREFVRGWKETRKEVRAA